MRCNWREQSAVITDGSVYAGPSLWLRARLSCRPGLEAACKDPPYPAGEEMDVYVLQVSGVTLLAFPRAYSAAKWM